MQAKCIINASGSIQVNMKIFIHTHVTLMLNMNTFFPRKNIYKYVFTLGFKMPHCYVYTLPSNILHIRVVSLVTVQWLRELLSKQFLPALYFLLLHNADQFYRCGTFSLDCIVACDFSNPLFGALHYNKMPEHIPSNEILLLCHKFDTFRNYLLPRLVQPLFNFTLALNTNQIKKKKIFHQSIRQMNVVSFAAMNKMSEKEIIFPFRIRKKDVFLHLSRKV